MLSNQWIIIYMFLYFAILNNWHTYVHGNIDCHLNQTESDDDAGIPRDIFPYCRCNISTKTCYNEIKWKRPYPVKHHVTGYRLRFEDSGRYSCFQLQEDATTFVFDEAKGFDQDSTYTFTLTAQPINGRLDEKAMYIKCPKYAKIYNNLRLTTHVNTGDNHIFQVKYYGIPEPVVTWKFSRDIKECKNLTVLGNDEAIKITRSRHTKDKYMSTLEITKVTKDHEGCYTFHIHNYLWCVNDVYETECNTHGSLTVNQLHNPQQKKILGPVLGGVAGSLLFIVIIAFIYKYFILDKRHSPVGGPNQIVYVSHCATDEKEKEKLLKFASSLQRQLSGLTMIIDLTCHNEINNSGGMSQWVPEQMQKANKIIVVLSKLYLEMLDSGESDDNAHKINAEYNHIRNMIYESCQKAAKLVIVSDRVTAQDFPDIFQGRAWYSLPTETQSTVQDKDFVKILAVLSDKEIVQKPRQILNIQV